MKFPRFLILLSFTLALALRAPAAERITATIALTNAPTTNGMTITIAAGNTTVRTWTNSVSIASSQILTNSTAAGSATNLYNQLIASAPIGVAPIVMTSATNIVLYGQSGSGLTVTFSVPAGPDYASVTYATNTVTSAVAVRVPYSTEAAAQRTNIASALTDWLNLTANTNQLAQSAPAMAQLVGLTNAQTITGNKSFRGTNDLGYIGNGTNGVLWAPYLTAARSTNMIQYIVNPSDGTGMTGLQVGSGYLWRDTNGNPIFAFSPITFVFYTNATFYGTVDVRDGFTIYGSAAGVSNVPPAAVSWTNGTRFEATNSFSDLALRRFAITSLANGGNAGVVVGTNSFVEVSGPTAAFTLNGLNGSPNRDGHLVVIVNQTGYDMTVAHQSGVEPTAANRIVSLTGADRTSTGNGAATFIYSAAASRWILTGFDP